MSKPPIHVIFGRSAAGEIRKALAQSGRRERVIGQADNLSFGPINPPSASLRQEWAEREFAFDYDVIAQMDDPFWAEAISSDFSPVAWVCLYNAMEHAGFLEFVWRMGDSPFEVIDATGIEAQWNAKPFMIPSLGVMPAEQIIEAGLIGRQTALHPNVVEDYRKVWRRLRVENAPLRVVDGDKLVSAPITQFDKVVLSSVNAEWLKGALVVGYAMDHLMNKRPVGESTSDLLLWSRVCALAEEGVLEFSGNQTNLHDTFVRRSRSPAMR